MRSDIRVYAAALRRRLFRIVGRDVDHPYPAAPAGTCLSPYDGHRAEIAAAPRKLALPDDLDATRVAEWQTEARARLAQLTGWSARRPQPIVTAIRDAPPPETGLVRRTVFLRMRPDCDVPVHLIEPTKTSTDDTPRPLMLYMAGSTSGVHLGWGEARVPIDHQRLALDCDLARQAARRGYLVAAIEQVGFGERAERRLKPRSHARTADAQAHALLLGRSLMGEKALDLSGTLDWILSQPDLRADPDRVHMIGHSAGGTAALYAAALDVRITATLCSGSIGPVAETVGARRSDDGDGIVPGLLSWFETDDLIALCAPRAFIALSGKVDHIFPFAGAARCVEGALPAYAALGAEHRLTAYPAPAGHRYYAQESWAAWQSIVGLP